MKDWKREAEIDASMSKFLREAEEEYQKQEAEEGLVYLIKGKWGIDDFEDRGRGRQ